MNDGSHDSMAPRRRPGGSCERTRHQHGADARHEPRRGDHPRPRGGGETMGRDRRHPPEGQDRRAPSWTRRERHLCGERTRPHALGRAARIRGRGRPRRLHLRPALTSPIRRSTPATTSRCPACWCAAVRSRWSSISICRTSSETRKRSSGSTIFIRPKADEVQATNRLPTGAEPDAARGLASPRARAPGSDDPRAESRRKDRR